MMRLIYQVYVGAPSKLYDRCIESVAQYCADNNIEHIVQRAPRLFITPDPFTTGRSREAVDRLGYLPIFEKENAFDYLHSYDQVAIIDSDVYIRPGSPNIFDAMHPGFDFGGVVEREMLITEAYQQKIIGYSRMQYELLHQPLAGLDFSPTALGYEFFNMGVMVLNKSILSKLNGMTPKEFIRQPDFKRFVDGRGAWKWSTDQTLLNYWLKRDKISAYHLHWQWNGLYTANPRATECHFVHFFLKDKLPNRGENVEELLKNV